MWTPSAFRFLCRVHQPISAYFGPAHFGPLKGTHMNWSLDPIDGDDRTITLCEEHALSETNLMVKVTDIGFDPFESMNEAYVFLTALASLAGLDLGLTQTDIPCEECAVTLTEAS